MADPVKPFTRWTADTRTAFLLALRLHGRVREAAGAIGRSLGSAYKVRERDAEFAAEWAKVVADAQADWVAAQAEARGDDPAAPPEPRIGRERRDGWSEAKRRRFLGMLAREGSVAEACRAVGLSATSARSLRRRSPAFAAAWDRALNEQSLSPIEAAYARAVEGWEEPIVFQGQVVAVKRRYSDAALRLLIQREDKRVAEAAVLAAAATVRGEKRFAEAEDTDRTIMAKLAAIERRRVGAGREAAIAFAERMVLEGKAP